jgi:hypothetical protein
MDMNTQNREGWSQLWYHIYGVAGLNDQLKVSLLKTCNVKSRPFSIPLTWKFKELHLFTFKTTCPENIKPRLSKRDFSIRSRSMDRVIVFSDCQQELYSNLHIFSEAGRILTVDGRLTVIIKDRSSILKEKNLHLNDKSLNLNVRISKQLNQFGFSSVTVGNYLPAYTFIKTDGKTSDRKTSNIIIATAILINWRS